MWDKSEAEKTFCPLPWNHLSTNTRGQLRLCCNSTPKINILKDNKGNPIYVDKLKDKTSLDNNLMLNRIRGQMLSGKKPIECEKCFKEELSGIQSPRKDFFNHYPIINEAIQTTNINGSTDHKIQYIDLRLSNLCNLRCRMCNPHTSRKLIKEALDLNLISKNEAEIVQNSKTNIKNLQIFFNQYLNHIDMIYLAGGEPTLIKEHLILLTKCIENNLAKNITLKYNTNTTNISAEFIDYWKEFKTVLLNCSVDGVGKVNEYIRNPSDWNIIDENLHKIESYMDKYKNLYSEIHTTVQVYNITHLIDLFEYLKQYKHLVKFPFLNILLYPPYFSIKILPKHIKSQISKELLKWFKGHFNFYIDTSSDTITKIHKLPQLIKFMNTEDWSEYNPKFKFYTEFYDKNRNENFIELNPKLKEWYKAI